MSDHLAGEAVVLQIEARPLEAVLLEGGNIARRSCPECTAGHCTPCIDVSGGANMLTSQQWDALAREVDMPPRELRVAKLLTAGLSEKAIARRLALSQHTVHGYIRSVYRRLEVHSRAEFFTRIVAAAS